MTTRSLFIVLIGLLFIVDYAESKGLVQNAQFTSLCLHAVDGSTANGASVEAVTCDMSHRDQWINIQNWKQYIKRPGYIVLEASGKCLSVDPVSSTIIQTQCSSEDNQKWYINVTASDGSVQLQSSVKVACLRSSSAGEVSLSPCGTPETSKTTEFPATYWNQIQFSKIVGQAGGGLVSKLNGKCLAIPSNNQGTVVDLETCNLASTRQQWNVLDWLVKPDMGSGSPPTTAWITNTAFAGKVLAVADATQIQNGASVQLFTQGSLSTPPDHQQWYFQPYSKGILESKLLPGKCLSITNENDDTGLLLIDCDLADHNQWLNVKSWQTYTDSTQGHVIFTSSSKCLTVYLEGTGQANPVNLFHCVAQTNQYWSVVSGAYGGVFELKAQNSGLCLSANDNGIGMTQEVCDDNTGLGLASYWEVIEAPSADVFQVISGNSPEGSPKCLTATNNGASSTLQDCTGATNQLWTRALAGLTSKPQGGSCSTNTDCVSGVCNQLLGIGSCGKAGTGGGCRTNSDCTQGHCVDGICQCTKYNAASCLLDKDCCSNKCGLLSGAGLLKCGCSPQDGPCRNNTDCCTGKCDLGIPTQGFVGTNMCVCKFAGEACHDDNCPFDMSPGDECCSGVCSGGVCATASNGKFCNYPNGTDCTGGNCRAGNYCGPVLDPDTDECSSDANCQSIFGTGFACRGGKCCKAKGTPTRCDKRGLPPADDGSFVNPGCCSGKCYSKGRSCHNGLWTANCFKNGPVCA